jgi:hypothetical protein
MASLIRSGTLLVNLAGFALAACAATTAAPPRDARAEKELAGLLERRDALEDQFEKSELEYRRQCELSDGECRMQLIDRRAELLGAHSTSQCKAEADSEREVRCAAKELAAFGELEVAADYYGFESWCFERLTACTAGLERAAAEAASRERVERRLSVIGASDEGVALRASVEFAKEKIKYMRSTLLPGTEEVCRNESESERCLAEVEDQTRALRDELGKPDGEYDAEAGVSLYRAASNAAVSCHEPESTCLAGELTNLGVTRHNRRLLQKSLGALEERQSLLARAEAEAGKKCLAEAIEKHQPKIVQDYQLYARQRVAYFWAQLHKAFLALHQSQVRCLKQSETAPSASAATGGGPFAAR